MQKYLRKWTVFLTVGLCLWPVLSQATLVRAMNLQELVGDAQYIVKAQVTAKDTQADPEESGMIVTYYTLQIQEYLKGAPAADGELVIKQVAQGEFANSAGRSYRQNFYFPEYQVGKTYLFFLPEAHERTGLLAPVGLQQGVFEVVNQNGQEQIPQLSTRRRMLGRGISQKNASLRFLSTQLNADSSDSSYNSFKALIETAGGAQ